MATSEKLVPQCTECKRLWLPGSEERWLAYWTDLDELSFYCPECAQREFGNE